MTVRVRLSDRFTVSCCDVPVDHELSDQGARAWVRVSVSARRVGKIVLHLHLGFGSDVSMMARLNYSVTVRRVMSIFMVGFCSKCQG